MRLCKHWNCTWKTMRFNKRFDVKVYYYYHFIRSFDFQILLRIIIKVKYMSRYRLSYQISLTMKQISSTMSDWPCSGGQLALCSLSSPTNQLSRLLQIVWHSTQPHKRCCRFLMCYVNEWQLNHWTLCYKLQKYEVY